MPDYLEYQKSIAQEFKTQEKRVRQLIDAANWAEEGRYKEILVMNYLKRQSPNSLLLGQVLSKTVRRLQSKSISLFMITSFPHFFGR